MLGSRLEEILLEEQSNGSNMTSMATDENTQRQLLQEDEEEDYLDEGKMSWRELFEHFFLIFNFTFKSELYIDIIKLSYGTKDGWLYSPAWNYIFSERNLSNITTGSTPSTWPCGKTWSQTVSVSWVGRGNASWIGLCKKYKRSWTFSYTWLVDWWEMFQAQN